MLEPVLESWKRTVVFKLQHALESSEWLVKIQNAQATLQSF